MAVYGYVRVSTGRQAEEGESLAAQQRAIEGYAMIQGTPMDRVFVERAVSGAKPLSDRPEGSMMLGVIQPGDVVITAKLDRMFPSALDALNICNTFKEQGISLHMIDLGGDVTGNGISRLVFTILSAVAEAERDRIRERISDVKQDQKARGRYLGGAIPFGYRVDGDGALIEHPKEQAAIQKMEAMQQGGQSLRAISKNLNDDGFKISHVGVAKILRSRRARAAA